MPRNSDLGDMLEMVSVAADHLKDLEEAARRPGAEELRREIAAAVERVGATRRMLLKMARN